MDYKEQENLTEHIRSVLHNHHEPYVLGSWERFNRHKLQKQKKQKFNYLFRAAAVLLISAGSLFAWLQSGQDIPAHLAEELFPGPAEQPALPSRELPPVDVDVSSVFNENGQPETQGIPDVYAATIQGIAEDTEPGFGSYDEPAHISYRPVTAQRISDSGRLQLLATLHDSFISPGPETPGIPNIPPGLNRNTEFLANSYSNMYPADSDFIRYVPGESGKHFTFGLVYAPFMNIHESHASPGMSGGVYADWNVTGRISLTSGLLLAQNQLKYGMEHGSLMQTFLASENNTTTSTTSGEISQIRVDLLGLEVPLGIRYSISDSFFLSAGISSVTFFKESYGYEFEFEQQIQVFTDVNNRVESTTETVRLTETFQQSEPSFQAVDLAAFYTFSLGYRFEVAERHKLSIEPFLKIPNQQVASRDIRYTTGGMQVTLAF